LRWIKPVQAILPRTEASSRRGEERGEGSGGVAGDLPITLNFLLFGVAAAAVWAAGTHLAVAAEELSDRRNLGKELMGLIFLAGATELPELVTTLFAAATDQASLLLNNMFGGIALQTAILSIADIVALKVAISRFPRSPTPILEGVLLILILALLLGTIHIGERVLVAHVGVGAVVLAGIYLGMIGLLRRQDGREIWLPVDLPEPPAGATRPRLLAIAAVSTDRALMMRFGLSSLVILVFGVLLVVTAESLAVQTGLGKSFVGATLLAGSTSLPELSTTIMAVRLHSYTMAISNIFGSNLIMVVLILPADIVFTGGPLLQYADKSAAFALIVGIVVTAIYVVGLTLRGAGRCFGMGYDSTAVLIVYVASLFGLYLLR
jgi:cation:H+ antiporter